MLTGFAKFLAKKKFIGETRQSPYDTRWVCLGSPVAARPWAITQRLSLGIYEWQHKHVCLWCGIHAVKKIFFSQRLMEKKFFSVTVPRIANAI